MALALDASTPTKVVKTATGNTATTASFTAPANALLVAFWAQDETGPVSTTIADTGGLTWTRAYRLCTQTVGEANTPTPTGTAQDGYVSAWYATTSSSAARTVTVTEAGSGGTGKEGMLSVKVYTDSGGAPTVGAIATKGGSASAPSHSVTTTAANSWVWAGSNDWSASGTGTAGSGQTLVDTNDTTNDAQHVWRQTATTSGSGTAVTMNLTAPSSQTWNMGVIEIKANSSGGSAVSGDASRTITAGLTAAANTAGIAGASQSVTAGLSAAATRATTGAASLSATAGLTAAATRAAAGDASGAFTATLTAAATVTSGALADAALAASAGLTAAATRAATGQASLPTAATLTAAATVAKTGSASLPLAATLTADATVSSPSVTTADTSLALTATLTATLELSTHAWTFITPTRVQRSGGDSFWDRVKSTEGLSVVRYEDGRFRTTPMYDPDEPGVAKVYLGGHVHTVTNSEATALTEAGYGAYLTEVTE